MTEAMEAKAKPRIPWVTLAIQIICGGTLALSVRGLVDYSNCNDCKTLGFYIFGTVWGAIGLLSGIRNRAGLIFLVLSIAIPLLLIWAIFYLGLLFLLIVFLLMSVSKEQLAPYYRAESSW